jgi:hypothetical protein
MKRANLAAVLLWCGIASAQQVHFDYDRSANFGAYKTYQWVDRRPPASGDELLDQDIKRAADEQLTGKGLQRVETGGDLQVSYEGAISQEREFDSISFGPGWWGDRRVISSTIETGTLVVELFDQAAGHLVWRGSVSKTLDIKKDPDKNYRNLQKALAKLFQTYPPGAGRH